MPKEQNINISEERRQLQHNGVRILKEIAEQKKTTPSADTSTLSPGYIESRQAPKAGFLPSTRLQTQSGRYANKELDRIYSDNSSDNERMIKAVCESAVLSSIDPTPIQMLSHPGLDKTMLLSLLDLLTSDPKKYMEIRNTRNNEKSEAGVVRLLNLMYEIKRQYKLVANDGTHKLVANDGTLVELLERKVMGVIQAQWSQELRNIVQANQQTPGNEPNIGYATQLQQDIMGMGIGRVSLQ